MPSEPSPDDLLSAAKRAYSGLPIVIEEPTAEEAETGTRRFSYTEGDKTVSGLARAHGNDVTVTSLEIRSTAPQGAVTSSMVISVRVGEIIASLRTLLAMERATREGPDAFSYTPAPAPAATKQPRRGGRPPVTDAMLRWLAEAYILETAEGKPPRPLARIAEQIGRPEETVRTWLAKARREGWLAPGVRGRAGGEPGPKLIAEILEGTRKATERMQEFLDRDPETTESPRRPGRLVIPGHYDPEYMRQQGVID